MRPLGASVALNAALFCAAPGAAGTCPAEGGTAWRTIAHSTELDVVGPRVELSGLSRCQPGMKVMGGGAASFVADPVPGGPEDLFRSADLPLVQSRPSPDGTAWIARAVGPSSQSAATQRYRLTVHAICACAPAAAGEGEDADPRRMPEEKDER